jgi:hypothetical protein
MTFGLVLHNAGSSATCVRPQGESIVDLTWSSPAAARWVESWGVLDDVETLSDHLYIEVAVRVTPRDVLDRRARNAAVSKRWALTKLDPHYPPRRK